VHESTWTTGSELLRVTDANRACECECLASNLHLRRSRSPLSVPVLPRPLCSARAKAKAVNELLSDERRLSEERAKAQKMRENMKGMQSDQPSADGRLMMIRVFITRCSLACMPCFAVHTAVRAIATLKVAAATVVVTRTSTAASSPPPQRENNRSRRTRMRRARRQSQHHHRRQPMRRKRRRRRGNERRRKRRSALIHMDQHRRH
jgi:hypothetical protein